MQMHFSTLHAPFSTVVGVLISNGTIKKLQHQKQAKFTIRELVRANRQAKTVLYFFALKGVDLKRKQIQGIYFHEQEQLWQEATFPFPDVLYSRMRSIEGKKGQYMRKYMQKQGVQCLNARSAFDKWDVHQRLAGIEEMRPHLPFTKPYTGPQDLRNMLTRTSPIYIKTRMGRRGQHIIWVRKQPEGGYECRYIDQHLVIHHEWHFSDLVAKIDTFLKGKQAIMQEAIDVLTIDDQNVDMRAEIQRNGSGALEVLGIFSRVGSGKSPVTNLPSGARFYPFDDFVENELHYSSEKRSFLRHRIEAFVRKVHTTMEHCYGPLGETAIDFALDQNQQLWFIECNAASTKLSFPITNAEAQVIRRVFLNPLQYAKYIHHQKG